MDDEVFRLQGVDRVFFFHIPKNAGMSMVDAIRTCYPRNYIRAKRGFDSHEQLLQDLASPDYLVKTGHIRNPQSGNSGTELVVGHLNYGIHRMLPGRSLYVAFLREPISRLLSLYHNYRRNRPNRLTVAGKLLPFVESYVHLSNQERVDVYNEQAKILTGRFLHDDPACMVSQPEGLGAEARRIIGSDIFFTGICEHFDESVDILKALLGLSRLQVAHINQGGYDFDRRSLSKIERKTLVRLNPADFEAYNAALEKFRRLAAYVRSVEDRACVAERVQDWILGTAAGGAASEPVPPLPVRAEAAGVADGR